MQYTYAIQNERHHLSDIKIHHRVCKRHPELSEEDILSAWDNALKSGVRDGSAFNVCVVVGIDKKGRLLEMFGVRDVTEAWNIYHAMTPPSKKTLLELGLASKRRK